MILEMNREDLNKAILKYVKEEIIGYGKLSEYDIKITQGKSASAKVELVRVVQDISE